MAGGLRELNANIVRAVTMKNLPHVDDDILLSSSL
jgi:hypothetical protein